MSSLESLRALQKRIREATGPDRELDVRIVCALLAPETAYVEQSKFNGAWCIYDGVSRNGNAAFWEPRNRKLQELYRAELTTYPDGLGACVALMHATLPGWAWKKHINGTFGIALPEGTCPVYSLPLANDCLTFIDAICAARIAELDAEQKEKADV